METLASFHTAYQMQEAVRPILSRAQNPFGVYTQGEEQRSNWFGTPEAGAEGETPGNTMAILDPAKAVAQAYRFQPVPPYQRFVLGQLNWLLGNNPLDAMLIDLPREGETDGYGTVSNGIAGRAPGDDRPVRVNTAPSLTNNARLIEVLANYKRVRLAM